MLIAFWSNIKGKNGVTSNLASICVANAIEHKGKNLVFENHVELNNLESAFIGNRDSGVLKEGAAYYFNSVGLDTLIKKINSRMNQVHMIDGVSMHFLNDTIYYLPQCNTMNKEVLEYDLNKVIRPLLDKVRRFADIVFVDTANSNSLSTKVILDKADIVVINLSQDPNVLEHFFYNYNSLISKSIFLIGNYNPKSKYNLNNIRRKYKINREDIAVIPYNIAFKDAFHEGRVIEFLLRNYYLDKEDENYYYIKELKKAVRMINNRMKLCMEDSKNSNCCSIQITHDSMNRVDTEQEV